MALETIQEILDSGSDSIKMSRLRLRLQSVFPELKESEDNRMREWCISHFRACSRVAKDNAEYKEYLNNKVIPWLEKQGEKKHVSITDEWIEDYWQHEKVNNPYSYDKGDEIQFDHQGFVRFCKKYCQEPTNKIEPKPTWSEEDEEMRLTILQDLQYIKDHFPEVNVEPEFNWLKSLKERCELPHKPEQG